MRESTAEYFRTRAALARRFADILPDTDQTGRALQELALEHDAKALQADAADSRGRW
jgi:hypothetical protein